MSEVMALGNDGISTKGQATLDSKADGRASDDAAAKAWNEKSVKYKEQIYWLKLELDTALKEKRAVERRMSKLYGDIQQLKDLSPKDSSELVALVQKHERTVSMLQTQIDLLRSSSNQVVTSLKDEIKNVLEEKSKSDAELLTTVTDLEKKLAAAEKPRNADGEKAELLKEIAKLKREKAEIVETLQKERAAANSTVSALRKDKTLLAEQVEKMQGDLLVLRASVDTVNSIDQMVKDRDESMHALEQVGSLWDRVDNTLAELQGIMEPLMEEDGTGEDQKKYLVALEKASLLHGQVKVALMLVEMKLRNTLACLKNDSSQLAVAITDPGVVEKINDAKSEALAEIRQVADLFQKQLVELSVEADFAPKVQKASDLQAKQAQMEKDIATMSLQALSEMAKNHAAGSTSSEMELLVGRKLLNRLQAELLNVVSKLQGKNESIGRLEATEIEYRARERALIAELKRFMKAHSMKINQDRSNLTLLRMLESDHAGMSDDEEEVEIVEDVVLEEEIIEEEIIEEPGHPKASKLGIMIEEEEEIIEE